MKQLKDIILEKLVFNKHTKAKQYDLHNASLDEFKKLIKEKLDYDLTYEDFRNFRGFLHNSKKTTEAKFTDITDDDKEWSVYYPISTNNLDKFKNYFVIQELNNGCCIFDFINTKLNVDRKDEYKIYRIGYILDNILNRGNRDMVKIFKIDFD